MDSFFAQQSLFEEIKQKLPESTNLAGSIGEVLNVSIDSAYRRLAGKTSITLDESILLAEKFNVDLSALISKDRGTISFERRFSLKSENDIAIHLKEMAEMMKIQIEHSAGPAIYTTKDIPVFYQFKFPELAAFKIFCWHRGLNTSEEIKSKFNPAETIKNYSNLFKSVEELYSKVPTIEIWSEISILSFIRQLQYYYDSGLMGNKEMALLLCDQHQQVFDLVKEQARLGSKLHNMENVPKSNTSFELYFNELFVMDNSVLANLNNGKVFINSYSNFNYIHTYDQQFCEDVEMWLNNQMKRSVKLSSSREKERNQFFKNINKELNLLIEYIKAN